MATNEASANPEGELRVVVQTPEGIVWEGNAQAVSSQNSAGPFDILPEHANMITLIEKRPITVVFKTETREFKFEKAIISVQENKVSIYADIAPGELQISEGQKVDNPK